MSDLVAPVLGWFAHHRRDLPWRAPGCSAWGVLVSEVMLAQTPVARVVPAWQTWMARWPRPVDLAQESPGEAVRAWDRLGYPRRALRLHAAAAVIAAQHDGAVPADEPALRALPGVGEYTAAAVLAFAFGQRSLVLDTNVRRVLARAVGGQALAPPSLNRAERARALAVLPAEPPRAAAWSAAVMELGALVCRARGPACPACPIQGRCAWVAAGRPEYAGPPRRVQPFVGTDRQARGRLLAVVREHREPVAHGALQAAWPDPVQGERALAGLVTDGLLDSLPGGWFGLPGSQWSGGVSPGA